VNVDLSGVSYSQGPLFGLISGGVSWRGTTPRIRIDVARLKLGVVSHGRWRVYWSMTEVDTIDVRNSTGPLDLALLKADFEAGEIGFSYDSTTYVARKRHVRQMIDSSMLRMIPVDEEGKRWSWEGSYRNRVTRLLRGKKDSLTIIAKGEISSVKGNGSRLYCREDGTGLLGNVVLDPSLLWGYFESVWGDVIFFGLQPADK
jgi:hypothetical protein